MLTIIRKNPVSFLLAIFVHVLLGVFLTFNMDWNAKHEVTAPTVNIIKAVMIDESKIRAEKERLQKLKDDKHRKIEQDKKRKEAEKRRKKEDEKKRKQEVERKKQADEKKRKVAAEKKRKVETEKKRKLEVEKKRKKETERKKQEADKKRKAERLRKLEEQKRKREAETQRLKAEEEAFRQQQIAEEQAAMNAARQKALQSERSKYINLIQNRVASKWAKPSGWRSGIQCSIRVRLVPGAGMGQVVDAKIVKSCGNQLFDRSVENAVFSASPLPFPTSPELINEFRDITFNFKPEG